MPLTNNLMGVVNTINLGPKEGVLKEIFKAELSGGTLPIAPTSSTAANAVGSAANIQANADLPPNLYGFDPRFIVNICSQPEGRKEVNVSAFLQQGPIGFGVANKWGAPFEDKLTGLMGDEANAIFSAATGLRAVTKDMSSMFWQGAEHTTMQLNLLLLARRNAKTEIRQKILDLMSLAVPSVDSTRFMKAPGPSLKVNENFSLDTVYNGASASGSTLAESLGFGTLDETAPGSTASKSPAPVSVQQKKGVLSGISTAFSEAITIQDKIQLKIGKFLFFDCVVINNVTPMWEQVLDIEGQPMVAMVEVQVTTFQIVTLEDLEQILVGGAALKT